MNNEPQMQHDLEITIINHYGGKIEIPFYCYNIMTCLLYTSDAADE